MKLKKLLIPFYLILSTLYLFSCGPNEPGDPPELVPIPGYQHDIPWPSLANTAWPMYRHDPQLTGRSPYAGPVAGVITKTVPAPYMTSSIIIGYNSTIIYTYLGNLAACNFNGIELWKLNLTSEISSTPLINSDSTIYVTTGSLNSLVAVSITGELKWEYKFETEAWSFSVAIGKDKNIYLVLGGKMVVLNTLGELIWELDDNQFNGSYYSGISFSPDGNQLYCQGNDVSLIAVNIKSRSIAWSFGDQKLESGAVIDNDGNVYILPNTIRGDKFLYCLYPDGNIKWKFEHELVIRANNIEPAIDYKGNIIFGREIIYSLNYRGKLNWKYDLGDNKLKSSIIVDSNNDIYLGTSINYNQLKIISMNIDGQINWELPITTETALGLTFTINSNNELLVPTYDSNNFIIIN